MIGYMAAYYIEVVNGTEVKVPKGRGPGKSSYVRVFPGIWIRRDHARTLYSPIVVMQCPNTVPLDDYLSNISSSSIDRKNTGVVTLFMCHVSPGCKCNELKLVKDAARIEFDLRLGTIRAWKLEYREDRPDYVIENAILCSPVNS